MFCQERRLGTSQPFNMHIHAHGVGVRHSVNEQFTRCEVDDYKPTFRDVVVGSSSLSGTKKGKQKCNTVAIIICKNMHMYINL